MANLSRNDILVVLEELYLKDNVIPDIIFRDNPVLGLLPKSTDGGGKYRHVHVKHIRPQGRSASFSEANTNNIGSQRVGFDVTWVNNYQVAAIDGDVIDDAKGNKVILIDHIKEEMDGAFDNLRDDLAMSVFRNGGGARGVAGTIGNGSGTNDLVTLEDPEDVAHFEVGMEIVFSNDDGSASGHSLRSSTASTIESIDRDAGTIEFDVNVSSTSSAAAGDYMFVKGDFQSKWSGFDAWVPTSAPTTGDDFFGVDRSVDPVRLAGVRYTGTGMSIEQAIIQGAARVRRWKKGSSIDLAVLNPIKWAQLEIGLEHRKEVQTIKGSGPAADIGYDAIMLATPNGKVPVVSDPNAPVDQCRLLKKDSWMIETVGDMVRLLDEDGLKIMRQASADGYDLRIKCRGNMWCKEPGANAVITI